MLVSVSFATTTFAPVVLGFFGLGTGYLIYGPQEAFGFPARDASVDRATGIWGLWLPGFCQFVTGIYLFGALTWFESLKSAPLYMAAVAFTAYGIHWFALGWNRYQGNDPRPTGLMSISFTVLSVLGAFVFFSAGAWPVGLLFTLLALVYISEFCATFRIGAPKVVDGKDETGEGGAPAPAGHNPAEKILGYVHIVTGVWLLYLTFATTLNIALHYSLPAG